MSIDIIERWTRAVLYHSENASDIRAAVLQAIKAGANLSGANLSYANLSYANLSGANLSGAYLSGANLSGANLSDANLSGANLSDANLSYANLSDANLSDANLSYANLSDANLSDANLSDANLSDANLSDANLSDANLSGAYLSGANLSGAYLSGADLSGAHLSGAEGVEAWRCTPLMMLLDQPGPIRAYKLVNANSEGPYNGGIVYKIGQDYAVENANTGPTCDYGAGINLATLDWCLRAWREGYRVIVMEFTAADIACIPIGTDGEFRVRRCKAVAEKDISALVAPQKATA